MKDTRCVQPGEWSIPWKSPIPHEEQIRIQRMFESGMEVGQIAKATGFTLDAVMNVADEECATPKYVGPYRCPGCGGKQHTKPCIVCRGRKRFEKRSAGS